jgi:RNA polymerase sigma factor (sigma-70 family)
VRAIRSRASYRREAPVEAWVWQIVVNAARDRRRSATTDDEWTPESCEDTPSVNGSSDDPLALRPWLASLPERQRTVVFLRYFADLDYQGIASVLGIEVGTVSATLSAAHARLRALKQQEVER